ncbi:CAAX prenyl protease 2 isoform X1 [Schistocerca americana]|uniref:CAAX prenyl protease 2 n=1 Tax=Schistocerca serialis cubense TaxID=2023355 RepID=UPI001F4F72E8|nr:CAAX prenyl protease 2 isoform X1 [Schistocerca americana]XP_049961223.1 CAAX prenyl protease 2 [Schistocerca serialis cubense]
MEDRRMKEYACISSIVACFLLSVVYVASLYVWNSPHNRDHPSTIKKRFLSVFIMMFVSPLFLYSFSREGILKKASIWELLGLRWQGLFPAAVIPLLLTMLLFLGPICMQGFSGLWKLYAEPRYWLANAQNLIWLRNHVVAPLSEEFTFRACMLPLLLQCFRPMTAVFVCPLFFGVAHFHHMVERMKTGLDFRHALMISCFQFAYTTLFGAYSAFLFARTGHFIAPFAAHAFCNHMGFPDFAELMTYKDQNRIVLMSLFVLGLVLWCVLLTPVTNPHWYSNNLFWKT